jgi:RnfABCDGE-type electron transport complex B subunit
MFAGVISAVAVLGGLGLLFGAMLALADRFFKVEEDPRIDAVEHLLPGSNCGACGQAGCRALAEQIVAGALAPSRCTVSSPSGLEAIADFLGVGVGYAALVLAGLRTWWVAAGSSARGAAWVSPTACARAPSTPCT